MSAPAPVPLQSRLDALGLPRPEHTPRLVDEVLAEAVRRGASDAHFEPTPHALELRFRLDGVLQAVATLPATAAANVVARLKVLADLLTYRLDVPQEGGVRRELNPHGVDMRVSTFPTIHGEKAVVRLFTAPDRVRDLDRLGLPPDVREALRGLLRERTGAVLLTGPSGSGKTTTIYACLRELVRQGGRHVVTIEDPVEQAVEGVSQSQARPGTEFDFARGLRSLLRQDPEVIMVGEVRDRETAATAVEAALTGHLVFSTLHAGSACGVVSRLLDMGLEPYLLTSALKGILNQRLVRRLCPACREPADEAAPAWVTPGPVWRAVGCPHCAGTGYQGRALLAELLTIEPPLRQAILARADLTALEAVVAASGKPTVWTDAGRAVGEGLSSPAEVERVLGPRP